MIQCDKICTKYRNSKSALLHNKSYVVFEVKQSDKKGGVRWHPSWHQPCYGTSPQLIALFLYDGTVSALDTHGEIWSKNRIGGTGCEVCKAPMKAEPRRQRNPRIDLTGLQFGWLAVIERQGIEKNLSGCATVLHGISDTKGHFIKSELTLLRP